MSGNASAIFGGGGGASVGSIVVGQFANNAAYLPLDGADYTSASYPSLDKTNLKTFGNNTFTSRSLPASGVWTGVCYGNSQFVAVGTNVCATSSDGITWTSRTIPTGAWYSIVYAGGQYVAGSSAGAIATSPDGITWTSRGTITSGGVYSIAYGNGVYVIGNGSTEINGSGQVYTSADAITWTARTAMASTLLAVSGATFYLGKFYANAYSLNTGTAFGQVLTSYDGITWFTPGYLAGSRNASANYYAIADNYIAPPALFKGKLIQPAGISNTWYQDTEVGIFTALQLPAHANTMTSLPNIGAVAISQQTTSNSYIHLSFDLKRWIHLPTSVTGRWMASYGGIAASPTRVVLMNQTTGGAVNTCQSIDIDTTKFRMPASYTVGIDNAEADRYYMKVA